MDHGVLVYKVDKSCTEFSIEFSYINPIQGSIHWSTLRSLSCNICAEEEKDIFVVKERDIQVHWRTIEKRVY